MIFEHRELQSLEEYFLGLSKRRERGIYFYRISGFDEQVKQFILKYYEAARASGVVIEGRIPNPDEKNLEYYEEIMGMSFQLSMGFLTSSLKKWLPRMRDAQRDQVAASIYDTLDELRRAGKNENMLRNAYIKFMCWLYYRFERVVNRLGEEQPPKILYEGEPGNYELKLLVVLAHAGCDVVLLQYGGDQNYRKLDPDSRLSFLFDRPGLGRFPEGFSLEGIRSELSRRAKEEQLYGTRSGLSRCTNAWIEGKGFSDILTEIPLRGQDPAFYYNCFIRIVGVEDRLTCPGELLQLQRQLTAGGRRLLILEGRIPRPDPEEIQSIRRGNYTSAETLIAGLSGNMKDFLNSLNIELQRLMNEAFVDIILEESGRPQMNLNRLTNKAVYLLCWLKRYASELFAGWKHPQIGCVICLGGCQDENEALFLRFLARLPVDVLILIPDLNGSCCLEDPFLYEIHYTESLLLEHFPQEGGAVQMGTAAYHAEQELTESMYRDSGIYRNYQYQKAVSVTLQTMYEEIAILWDQEVKYRPNFQTLENEVQLPVIFAKVSGVKDGQTGKYWGDIKKLITEETYVISGVPFLQATDPNPVRAHATEFLKNGKLQRTKLRSHACYAYGYLREEMQDYILDKLQLLIDQRLIRGTFENGTEYTIVSVILNLNKDILRLLQGFDFTKKNPKLIYINTSEKVISLEDSILTAFLNLAGFDVVFFVPTGYQSVEKHFSGKLLEEHQIGGYVYDLQPPDFRMVSVNTRPSWRDKIFKRGS